MRARTHAVGISAALLDVSIDRQLFVGLLDVVCNLERVGGRNRQFVHDREPSSTTSSPTCDNAVAMVGEFARWLPQCDVASAAESRYPRRMVRVLSGLVVALGSVLMLAACTTGQGRSTSTGSSGGASSASAATGSTATTTASTTSAVTASVTSTASNTVSATASGIGGGPKRVFVTHAEHDGLFGGLAGADTFCADAATAANLGGTFKAWLSDSNTNAIDRIVDVGPWYLVDGVTLVFINKANLATKPLAEISKDETGATPPMPAGLSYVWTGTLTGGQKDLDCAGWTNASLYARLGAWGTAPADWTSYTAGTCANTARLYCFEQ